MIRSISTCLLLTLAILLTKTSLAQSLSNITTRAEAETLIKSKFRSYGYKYDSIRIFPDTIGYDTFKKGDFNHDGIEDLLVFAYVHFKPVSTDQIIIILGGRKQSTKVEFPYLFFRGFGEHVIAYPKVITVDRSDLIQVSYSLYNYEKGKVVPGADTIFISHDRVVPFHKKKGSNSVKRIEYKTNHCYGTCPVYEFIINRDLNVLYNGLDHVDKKGSYDLRIDQADWNYLTEVIENLDIINLKDNYSVAWTDDQTGILKIVFDNGDEKLITDYGRSGTFGLSILYSYFNEMLKF